jgi:hypothetical protein
LGWRRIGRLTSGPYTEMYVQVERDRGGFHIWLSRAHPSEGPSEGWDIWADERDDVDAWFSSDLRSVEWLDGHAR